MWLILESWTNTQKKMWAARMGEKVYHIKGTCYHGCRSRLAGGMQRKQCYLNRTTKQNRRKQILSLLWRIDTTQTLITPLVFLAQCKQKSSGSNQLLWTNLLNFTTAHNFCPPDGNKFMQEKEKEKLFTNTIRAKTERAHTPMIAFSSAMVTCLARSTACTTCCWCYKWRSETEQNYWFSKLLSTDSYFYYLYLLF